MNSYTALHLFCGVGGAAIGMQQAVEEYRGMVGRFRTIAGIDCDLAACQDFEMLTGAPGLVMDLFSQEDYTAFHGHEPPPGWKEVTPVDLLEAVGGICPDMIFTSPPCKGFSGLLPGKSAASEKYQALNRLTVRGLRLALEAFSEDLPGIIMLENVPRITTRGTALLDEIKRLLKSHGYLFHEGYHDCGEIGGLGQRRKRYLLIARHPDKIKNFVYQPPQLRLKSIGEVIGSLPLPDDPAGGVMHRLPKLQWKTWVRLALIPAGGDWRDLEKIAPEQYRLEHIPRNSSMGVMDWEQPSGAVIGSARVGGSSAAAITDPRAARTVTGANRPNCKCRSGSYGVQFWDEPGKTVIGSGDIHSGTAAVADPRIPEDNENGTWVIIAPDGTWHRPLTTWELMALQGFPLYHQDGRPVVLAGNSDAKWRERVGNAVPPPAAKAIACQILRTLLLNKANVWELSPTEIWVSPESEQPELEVIDHDQTIKY